MSAVLTRKRAKTEQKDYVKIATVYARKVVRQKYQCRTIKLACQRFLDDLKKQKSKEYPYYLSKEKATHMCKFMELMPHTKGELSNLRSPHNRITLEPFQVFIFVNIGGWLRKDNGLRRFREAYVKIPRKNGKSVKAAGIGNYMFGADGEAGSEVYAGASSEKQANEVFKPAKIMAEKTPGFIRRFKIRINAGSLSKLDGSIFTRLVGNPGDGGSPHCAIVDEYHEHKNDNLFNTMKTGMLARNNSLMFVITTAGLDTSVPCYLYEQECINDLENGFNDRRFVAIWQLDKVEHWKVLSWVKAVNPNFGVSVVAEDLVADMQAAKRNPRLRSIFQQKHCNVWTSGEDAYFNMEHWGHGADSKLKESDFTEEDLYGGLDLASKIDIASDVRIYCRVVNGKNNYYLFGTHYVPEAMQDDPDFKTYHNWIEQGYLTATQGNKIDHFAIAKTIFETNQSKNLKMQGYDNDNASMLVSLLEKGDDKHEGIAIEKLIDVPQRRKYLSDAMKWLEAELKAGTIHHDDNPAMNWMMSNVLVAKRDYLYDNFFPIKQKQGNKIDGAVALMIGVAVMNSIVEETVDIDAFLSNPIIV